MSEQVFSHKPVLLDECIEALAIRPEGVYLDGTLGRAGHSREIVRRLTTGRLICVDRDQAALDAAEERLAPWRERVTLVHSNFCALDAILDGLGLDGVEVWHPDQSETDSARLAAFAAEHGLLTTGGSDFHGMYTPAARPLGSTAAPDECVEALLAFKDKKKRKNA